MSSGSVCLTSQQSLLPVTALEFCSVEGSLFLLAGEGPRLKVFSKHGGLLGQAELLPFGKIHGIHHAPPEHQPPTGGDESHRVLVFGQKSIRFVTLQPTNGSLRFECSSAIISLPDWVLDVCWLDSDGTGADSDAYRVAAATAHNVVHVVECCMSGNARVIATHGCEINCVLYSARLKCEGDSGLTVLSGTVFNDILLWRVQTGKECSPSTTESSVTTAKRVKVCLTLKGHEGVIFSVRMNACGSQLVSVSDDRTIRVWNLPPAWKSMEGHCLSSCSLLLYGHTARVWDGRLLHDRVISIGEDATCRVWDYEGRCVQVMEGHRGRSIWSMAVDENTGLVATGGGDCGIRLFSLKTQDGSHNTCVWSVDTTLPVSGLENRASGREEVPRLVELCDQTVLCLSNTGSLYAAEVPAIDVPDKPVTVWQLIHQDEEFSGYAVMSLSPDHQWLALGSLQGYISLLSMKTKVTELVSCDVKWWGHKGKVFSLTWLNTFRDHDNCLLSCGPSGEMVVWGVTRPVPTTQSSAVNPLFRLSLPPSKHRWVTTATLVQASPDGPTSAAAVANTVGESGLSSSSCWLVCGDRKGSLHVYQASLTSEYVQPLQSLYGVHGPNGVTQVTLRGGHVISCGRDGHCRTFSLLPHKGLTLLNKFKPVKGMDWVEKQFYSETDHLVLGFHTTEMVLNSVNGNRRLMSVHCGGGHRSYGFTALSELCRRKRAVVVYIKKSVVYIRVVDLTEQLNTPELQRGFVGREAISLTILHSDPVTGSGVVAVGSEDCSVCLLSLQPSPDGYSLSVSTKRFLRCHISSVRALSASQSGQRGLYTLLFSGGARASLKVWKINGCDVKGGVTLEAELWIHDDNSTGSSCSQRKRKQKKREKDSLLPECRIMALISVSLSEVVADNDAGRHYVAAGCSDGVIRQYIYCEERQCFTSLSDLSFHQRCILTLYHIVQQERLLYVLSAATDGRVAVWNIRRAWLVDNRPRSVGTGESGVRFEGELNGLTQPLAVCQAHQSGINDLAIQQVSDERYHIASVGDDNALVVLGLSLPPAEDRLHTACLEVLCADCNAHASSITGVSFLSDSVVVTTSIDQRLSIWRISTATECTARIDFMYSHTHDIADVSSLKLYCWRENKAVAVMCGIGIQCFVIQHSVRSS